MKFLERRVFLERLGSAAGALSLIGAGRAVAQVRGGVATLKNGQTNGRVVGEPGATVSPHDFGVERARAQRGFTAALAAARDADERAVAAHGRYVVDGLGLGEYGKLTGTDLVLARGAGNAPLLTIDSGIAGIQTTRRAVIDGVTIDGSRDGRRTGVGVSVGNSATLAARGLAITGCEVGLQLDRTQFASFLGLKLFNNRIGMTVTPSRSDGGGNSLTFVHPVVTGNDVGMAFVNKGNPWPQGDIVLMNPQFLGNAVCALAVVGASAAMRTQLYIYGCAPEANGLQHAGNGYAAGAPQARVADLAIPRCSMYLRHALVSIVGGAIGEYGNTDPCLVLEGTTLSLHDVEGYGGAASTFVKADAQSGVVISGYYGCIGTCHGVQSFTGHLSRTATQGALVGSLPLRFDPLLRNDLTDPEAIGSASATGVSDAAIGADGAGRYHRVSFAAEQGSADRNVVKVSLLQLNGVDRTIVSLTIVSDRDCRVRLSLYPNEGPVYVDLTAGRTVRLCYWLNHNLTGDRPFCLYPTTGNGPKISLRQGHALSGRFDDQHFTAACDQIAGGGYNPNTAALIPFGAQAIAPNSADYPVGAIVHNSAPGGGRPAYWQHLGNGDWKGSTLGH